MSCSCIKCGREIPEGQMLCGICSMPAAVPPPPPEPQKRKKRRSRQKPVNKEQVRKQLRRRLWALVILSLLLAAAAAYILWDLQKDLLRNEALRVREASVSLREQEADRQDAYIRELETALKEKSPAGSAAKTASGEITLAEENKLLRSEKMTLALEKQFLENSVAFYESHAVFAAPGAKYYHVFACNHFPEEPTEVFSPEAAEAEGYLPCPDCIS